MHDGFHEPSAVEQYRFLNSKTTASISIVYEIFSLSSVLRSGPSRSRSLEKWKIYVPFIPLIPTLAIYSFESYNANSPSPKPTCTGQFGNLLQSHNLTTKRIPPCH